MGLFFFKTPQHRVFNYQPLYYDERKEELEKKIENARRREKGEYVPGESIRGAFGRSGRGRYDSPRSSSYGQGRRIITLLSLVAFMIALVFVAKYLGFLII